MGWLYGIKASSHSSPGAPIFSNACCHILSDLDRPTYGMQYVGAKTKKKYPGAESRCVIFF